MTSNLNIKIKSNEEARLKIRLFSEIMQWKFDLPQFSLKKLGTPKKKSEATTVRSRNDAGLEGRVKKMFKPYRQNPVYIGVRDEALSI